MITRNTMVVPCMVKSWLYSWADRTVALGSASCVRISRASTPPTMKNRKAVTPYMIPMRLWSTVEIQLQKPCAAWGRANGRAGALVTATAMRGLLRGRRGQGQRGGPLLQRLQERDELVDLGLG